MKKASSSKSRMRARHMTFSPFLLSLFFLSRFLLSLSSSLLRSSLSFFFLLFSFVYFFSLPSPSFYVFYLLYDTYIHTVTSNLHKPPTILYILSHIHCAHVTPMPPQEAYTVGARYILDFWILVDRRRHVMLDIGQWPNEHNGIKKNNTNDFI